MLVSVTVTTCNSAPYIVKAMDSVRAQTLGTRTHGGLELVVCDDASQDDTVAIIEAYQKQHPDFPLRLVRNAANQGCPASRNRAYAAARGDWIAILDHDDWFEPERLERMLAVAEAQQADVVFDNLILRTVEGGFLRHALAAIDRPPFAIAGPEFVRHNRGRGFSYGYLKPLVRRAFLERHEILYRPYRFIEDFVFAMDCFMAGAKVVITPEPLYHYRLVPGSLSRMPDPTRYRIFLESNDDLIARAQALGQSGLAAALARRGGYIRTMIAFGELRDRIRQGRLLAALPVLAVHLRSWPAFAELATRRTRRNLAQAWRQRQEQRAARSHWQARSAQQLRP